MDEHTPIDVPIRLEEWDRHDCINEVDTIVVDIRPILDAADYDHLPAPDDWDADFIADEAQRLGLLRLWDGPFTVELPECGEYPAYIEWRGTHDDGRNQTQEGESDVSGAEGSQAGQ